VCAGSARDVDQRVQRPKPRDRIAHCGVDGGTVGDVAVDREVALAEVDGDLPGGIQVQVRQHQGGALLAKAAGSCRPDAVRAAGQKHRATVESFHVGPSRWPAIPSNQR